MIHPDTEVRFIDNQKGKGLFAVRPIPCGTITWSLDPLDREIKPPELESYDPLYQEILLKYSFRNKRGNYIFCWDNCRYTNHSFNANCCLSPYDFQIAIKDIQAGEEVTDDYGYLNIIEPFEADAEGGDRTFVYPDDLLRFSDMWDAQLTAAFSRIMQVEQPLKKYLPPKTWETIQEIHQGKIKPLSIRTCYYKG
ncbi:MAG: SET domain-containing protein [Desulforhopalus sp.]